MSLFRRATDTTQQATREVLSWPRRIRKWLLRSTEVLVVLVILSIAAVAWVLGNLDKPSISQPIIGYLQNSLGLTIRYQSLNASPLSDITARNFVIASPARFQRWAPDFLSLGSLELHWSPATALTDSPQVETLHLDGLQLTIVRDETGRTSLDELFPSAPDATPTPPSASPTPLSHLLDAYPAGLRVGDLKLTGVKLTLLEVNGDRLERQTEVDGLSLTLTAHPGADQRPWARLALGSRDQQPLTVRITTKAPPEPTQAEDAVKTLTSLLNLGIELQDKRVGFQLSGDLQQQSLSPLPFPPGRLLELTGALTFAPKDSRLELVVDKGSLLGQGATFSTRLLWPDTPSVETPPEVEQLSIEAILASWLPFLSLPPELTLAGGNLKLSGKGLQLDPQDYLPTGGTVALDGRLHRLAWADGAQQVSLETLRPVLSGTFTGPHTLSAQTRLEGTHLQYLGPTPPATPPGSRSRDTLTVERLSPALTLENVQLNLDALKKSSASLRLQLPLQGLAGTVSGHQLANGDLSLTAELPYPGALPSTANLALKLNRLLLTPAELPGVELQDLLLTSVAQDMVIDQDHPEKSAFTLSTALQWPVMTGKLKTTLQQSALSYELSTQTQTLTSVQALLQALLGPERALAWDSLGLTLQTHGKTLLGEGGALRALTQATQLHLTGLEYREGREAHPSLQLSTPTLDLTIDSQGSLADMTGNLTILAPGFKLNQSRHTEDLGLAVNSTFGLNRTRAEYALTLLADLGKKRTLETQLQASIAPMTRALTYNASLSFNDFPGLHELLNTYGQGVRTMPGTPLSVTFKSQGTLTGLVTGLEEGIPIIETAQRTQLNGDSQLKLQVQGLLWQQAEQRVSLPGVSLDGAAQFKDGTLESRFTLSHSGLTYQDGVDEVALSKGSHGLTIQSQSQQIPRSFWESPLHIHLKSEVDQLRQNYTDWYPAGDVAVALDAIYHPSLAARIESMTVTGQTWGTDLSLTALYDLRSDALRGNRMPLDLALPTTGTGASASASIGSPTPAPGSDGFAIPLSGGQVVAIQGVLKQRLEPLSTRPARFKGTGSVSIPFQIESPDQRLFRILCTLRFADASLTMPDSQLTVSHLTGAINLRESVRQQAQGWQLIPGEKRNAWTRSSFSDAQPFLNSNSYFTLQSLQYQDLLFQEMAGNLELDRDVFRLDQLQLVTQEGVVTGQLLYEYSPTNGQLLFRGNASGLKFTEEKERLDANLALNLSMGTLELNGQANIVRLGQKTLLGGLDVLDPYQEDVSYNRVRMGLKVGYPEAVRLSFDHGLMNAKIELGGAARQLRIDEIKGVSVGPLLNRYLLPYLPEGTKP